MISQQKKPKHPKEKQLLTKITNVLKLALDLLARREHSRYELQNKLEKRGFPFDEIEETLNQLSHEGLQSDERFAEIYCRSRMNRGYGPIRINHELCHRGITDEIIKQTINPHDEQWFELADRVRCKRFGKPLPKDYKTRAKQAQFLQYRGFSLDHINQVLKNETE